MKKFVAVFLCAVFLLLLTSCVDPDFHYEGEHMDLAAATLYSIPGVTSEANDEFVILEKDNYGRVMFLGLLRGGSLIREDVENWSGGVLTVMITQKADDTSVWFYEDRNYVMQIVPETLTLTETTVKTYFSEASLTALKEKNDWNAPLATEDPRMYKAPISLDKNTSKPMKMAASAINKVEEAIEEVNTRQILLRQHEDGRTLFFVLSIHREHDPMTYEWYMVMCDAKGRLMDEKKGIRLLNRTDDLATQVLGFCANNGWN